MYISVKKETRLLDPTQQLNGLYRFKIKPTNSEGHSRSLFARIYIVASRHSNASRSKT